MGSNDHHARKHNADGGHDAWHVDRFLGDLPEDVPLENGGVVHPINNGVRERRSLGHSDS